MSDGVSFVLTTQPNRIKPLGLPWETANAQAIVNVQLSPTDLPEVATWLTDRNKHSCFDRRANE